MKKNYNETNYLIIEVRNKLDFDFFKINIPDIFNIYYYDDQYRLTIKYILRDKKEYDEFYLYDDNNIFFYFNNKKFEVNKININEIINEILNISNN